MGKAFLGWAGGGAASEGRRMFKTRDVVRLLSGWTGCGKSRGGRKSLLQAPKRGHIL